VGRQLVDVNHGEAGGRERTRRGQQRQVLVVLVIDRVELTALDEPQ